MTDFEHLLAALVSGGVEFRLPRRSAAMPGM